MTERQADELTKEELIGARPGSVDTDLRGIYLRVVSDGRVRVGDRVRVLQRGS